MTEHTCERCGSQFTPRPGKRFCSEACRAKAERERYNARKPPKPRTEPKKRRATTCKDCGSTSGMGWWEGRLASPGSAGPRCHACYLAYSRQKDRRRANSPLLIGPKYGPPKPPYYTPPRSCVVCSGPYRGPGSRCGQCAHEHRKALSSSAQARRLEVVRSGDEGISWRSVAERDGWSCHLCGRLVRQIAGTAHEPLGATVDHLVPIAAGGLHTWDNVALAHRRCNLKRGAAGIVQLRLVG